MSRKELYAQVVKLNLQNKIKETYGINYTNCSNVELIKVIMDATTKPMCIKTKGVKECPIASDKKFEMLVKTLQERHLLLASDVVKIMNA